MHRSLKLLRLVTATLLLFLANPQTLIGTTPYISEALAQEPMNRDRKPEAERLEERIRDALGNLTLRIGLDPSLGSDTTDAKKVLEAIAYVEPLLGQHKDVQYILGRVTDIAFPSLVRYILELQVPLFKGDLGGSCCTSHEREPLYL